MAIGGMIGGGIFSVLGVTIDLAGHLAFAAFLVGAVIAGLTARAYARLAVHSGRSGGPFTYLREEGHPQAAAWVAWLLIAGYVFALAVYAFTFGHYLAHAVGAPATVARILGVGVLGAFVAINLRGVATSGLTEDVVVAVKLAVLGGVSLVGIASLTAERLAPLDNKGLLGVFLGAALIFVAYEGFELLPYDYDDIESPRRTLPRRALPLGGDRRAGLRSRHHRFPDAGLRSHARRAEGGRLRARRQGSARCVRPLGGDRRRRLLDRLGDQRDAVLHRAPDPRRQRRWRAAVDAGPRAARASGHRSRLDRDRRRRLLAAAGISEVVSFGSLTFLLVFGLVNLLHARHTAAPGWDRGLAWLGGAACFVAAGALLFELARSDRPALALIGVCGVAVGGGRLAFVRSRHA